MILFVDETHQKGSAHESRTSVESASAHDVSNSSEKETTCATIVRSSCGLEIFYCLWLYCRRRPLSEPKKVAVTFSWLQVLTGSYIHIIPVAAAIGIAVLKMNGYFIGADLAGPVGQNTAKFNAIQFASKLHELTMHASIASIILSIVRYELRDGKVLPFGAIFAGLQFKEISFLWSAEFWGLAVSREIHWYKRVVLLSVIIVSALLAVSVGPASAIAMQPRLENFSGGGSSLWLNATSKDFWPERLDSTSLPGLYCQSSDAPGCPSSDWWLIRDFVGFFNDSSYPDFPDGVPVFPYVWIFPTSHGYHQMSHHFRFGVYKSEDTFASMPHYAISGAAAVVSYAWTDAAYNAPAPWRYKWRDADNFGVETRDAYAAAHCSPATIVNFNQTIIQFPSLAPDSSPDEDIWFFNLSSSTPANIELRFRLFENPGMTLTWIMNPSDGRYVSAAITTPGQALPGKPMWKRSLMTCSVSSCWANSTIERWTTDRSISVMHVKGFPRNVDDTERVVMTSEWLEALNPFIVREQNTVFNLIADPVDLEPTERKYAMELILAAMVTNGMSKLGYNATLQSEVVPNWEEEFMVGRQAYKGPDSNQDWSKFVLKMTVHGYAYKMNSTTDLAAVIILFIYSACAIAHLGWTIFCVRMSSGAWSSVGEVTALAMNSKPTTMMRNTCAGVLSTANYSAPIRILEGDGDGDDAMGMADHLEIVFGKAGVDNDTTTNNNRNGRGFKADKFYG